MSTTKKTQLLVIGAGPGGYPAAFHGADLGMHVTLVDPEPNPGGVCLYRGCIPSKALLHVVAFMHEVEQAADWGITMGDVEVDIKKLRGAKDTVVKKLTGGLGQLVKQRKIEYRRGKARLLDGAAATIVTEEGNEQRIEFEHAVVATGSLPAMIPGLPASDRIMTSRQALDIETAPERLLVVGGGYIGLELGQVYAALGSGVTVVEMLPEILPGADRDLVRFLAKRLNGQFEAIRTGTKVEKMEEQDDGIHVFFGDGKPGEDVFDKVMISVGRKPMTQDVGLEEAGVDLTDDGFIAVDEQRRTSQKTIFAVGDVAGQPMLAHKATHEAIVAVEAAAGKKTVFEPRAIPAVVFSDPEVAWTGLTANEAEAQGREATITTFPWAASGRAMTLGRTEGLTKLLSDPESGRILGCGMVGHGAGELIAEATLAIEMGAVADDLALTIHAHPTLAETVMEAAEAFNGYSTHFKKGG